MTDQDLIKKAKNLHALIYQHDCYSATDVIEYIKTEEELHKRGYICDVIETLEITKEDD
jgi:hypothetical protein